MKVKAAPTSAIPEAGSDALTFDPFDEVSQRIRDLLLLSSKMHHVKVSREQDLKFVLSYHCHSATFGTHFVLLF
jgi:hypothetical protein